MLIEKQTKKNKINNNIALNNTHNYSVLKNNINNDFSEINQSIISNDIKKLEFLIKSGKNPNICNSYRETPIFTCIYLNNIESLYFLLGNGANINFQNNKGNTPLHISIIKKNENITRILLENKANPNIKNSNYQTPFHLAIINKLNKNLLIKFKENNVDWNIKDKFNKTPFDYSLELNDNNFLQLLDNIFGNINNNKKTNEINANNYKILLNKIKDNYNVLNKKIIYKCKDENKENNNFYNIYNIIGDTNANTMSEVHSPRDFNIIKSKNKYITFNEIKENKKNENEIYDIRNFTLTKKNNNESGDDSIINEKENTDNKIKSCKKIGNKEIMKRIIMDTIKKVNHYQTYNKNSNSKNNLDEEINKDNNNSNKIKISERINYSTLNRLNPSETNNLNSVISTTLLDETELNSINKTNLEETLKRESNNENIKNEQIILKDLIDNKSLKDDNMQNNINNIDINNEMMNNNKKTNMKYMILQQIKEKNKKLELGSPLTIPNEILSKLRYWLISCDLLNYYNLLIEKQLYNIDEIIFLIKHKQLEIDYKYVEELGIKKPGHIFRFLLKLQIDADILNKQLCDSILKKFSFNNSSTILVNTTSNDYKCCGISCFCHNATPSNVSDTINNINNNDIFSFLRNKDLFEFKDNFLHNGFDQVDYIIIQLFSDYKFNKNMINDYFHIYIADSQKKVIQKLYEEKGKISKELNIPYDQDELNKILESFNDKKEKQNIDSCFIF